MRPLASLFVGAALALAIACGGAAKPSVGAVPPADNARGELERLDQAITADMQALGEARPAPPVASCAENCAEPLGVQSAKLKAPLEATCKPPENETCTQSGTLRKSICDNAGRICEIAVKDLAGKDGYANDACNRGAASCEAATKRYCSCM